MLSNLIRKDQIIPNDVEKYKSENFTGIGLEEVQIISKPEDNPDDLSAELMIQNHITNSALYGLSPFSFNWNQYKNIYSLLGIFKKFSNSIALSSCRIDAIAKDPKLVEMIQYFGSSSITVAIEGISQRIRNFLDKGLSEEELYVGFDHIIKAGFTTIKIYYIYCGNENEEDFKEFEVFLQKLDELRKRNGRPNQNIRMSFTPLLSTLGTPIQYHESNLARSMKIDTSIIYKIRQVCARYGFSIRLSSSVASSEFAQMVEFTDRRATPLFSYGSLNGFSFTNRFQVCFYSGEVEISKTDFNKLKANQKIEIDGKYYKIEFQDKVNLNTLHALVNEWQLFNEYTIFEMYEHFKNLEGKTLDNKMLQVFPPTRQKQVAGRKIKVIESDPQDLLLEYSNGKPQYCFKGNVKMSGYSVDVMKRYLPIVTNGVTYKDIISQKDPLYVFTNSHMRYHRAKHIGADCQRYLANIASMNSTYCIAINKCLSCGKCENTIDIKEIASTQIEKGVDNFHKITQKQKDDITNQRVLIEVNIDKGPYGGMIPAFLKIIINRAILKASKGTLTKHLLAEKTFDHSRKQYKLKQDTFKSILSGTFLQEVHFNKGVILTQEYLDELLKEINQFSTEGWSIENMVLLPSEYTLNKNLKLSLIEFRFDSRRVKGIDYTLLSKRVKAIKNGSLNLQYKKQVVTGRSQVRIEIEEFDLTKIRHIEAAVGSNTYECVLKVLMEIEDAHPMIVLSGLLGEKNPKSYASLLGTEIDIIGFYKDVEKTSNVFDIGGGSKYDTSCSICGNQRLFNVVTGRPFGDYHKEQIHPDTSNDVCVQCYMENTN